MNNFELVVNGEGLKLSIPTKCLSRGVSFLLAGLVTLLGTFGLKVELRQYRTDDSGVEVLK